MKDALELIQAINSSHIAKMDDIDIPAVIIPNNCAIKSLEHLEESPFAHIAKFNTHILDEFKDYSKQNIHESSAIYIDTKKMQATAIFDHGDNEVPLWGHQRALLTLLKTPAYGELLDYADNCHEQQTLIDFFQDWQANIQFYNKDGDVIDFKKAINLIRRITVNNKTSTESDQGDFNNKRSAMESIEVTAGDEQLPSFFNFMTEPYESFEQKIISCNIRALSNGSQASLKYRIESLQATTEDIANEFKYKIINKLPSARIYIGTMQHR